MAKQEWPPEKWQPRYGKFKEYSAWYSGNRRKLMDVYSIKRNPHSAKGAFWGQNIPEGESRTMVHVPVAGDIATAAMALYPIHLAHRHKLGRLLIARMLANVAVDVIVGAVPILGDIFDVAWKANNRNLQLLLRAAKGPGDRQR